MYIGKMQYSAAIGIPVNCLLMADEGSTFKCVPNLIHDNAAHFFSWSIEVVVV
jgi:hypothetical protein